MCGDHTSLIRLVQSWTFSHLLRPYPNNVERPHRIHFQYPLKIFQGVWPVFGEGTHGYPNACTVDDGIGRTERILQTAKRILHICFGRNLSRRAYMYCVCVCVCVCVCCTIAI